MNYPCWDVPIIGGVWVIGAMAIVHIMISHFAIGGGLYLPVAEYRALRNKRPDWMPVLKGHAKFFLILTAALGTVTGVGIWFAIGLANPEGTSTLIHYFVFAWATEWAFFLMEITAAAVYYYTFGRISDELHLKVGWFYAFSSFFTLFIINGILTFMLYPGEAWLKLINAGNGQEADAFWAAFFNPTFWPSLLLRICVCAALAGVWAFFTAARMDENHHGRLKEEFARFSVLWLVPGFVLMPVLFLLYIYCVPAGQRILLELGTHTIGVGIFTQVTRMAAVAIGGSISIAVIAYLMVWRAPRELRMWQAVAIFLVAFVTFGSTEYTREMLRKPFVVGGHLYSNGSRVNDVPKLNQEGYLAHSPWIRPEEKTGTTPEASLARGEVIFRGSCMACHTVDGYRSMKRLLGERDAKAIGSILSLLHDQPDDSKYKSFMPPLAATPSEIADLNAYLDKMAHPAPAK